MIYSCTMFGREFAQLDLKVAEELPYIDQMIVVEATRTHANQPKPLYLANRYSDKKVKIVTIGDQFTDDISKNEALQRNSSLPPELEDSDIVIYADDDEINHGREIPFIVEQAREHGFVKLKLAVYHYKINLRCHNPDTDRPYPHLQIVPNAPAEWIWSFAATGRFIREHKKPLTKLRYFPGPIIETSGKHFSYLGGPEEIAFKIQNSLHRTKCNTPEFTESEQIERKIRNRVSRLFEHPIKLSVVPIDETYPQAILANLAAWQPHIEPYN
jgi:hypothetical protein